MPAGPNRTGRAARSFLSRARRRQNTERGMPSTGPRRPNRPAPLEHSTHLEETRLTNFPADQRDLTQALIESAADRARVILSEPASAVALRQLGPDGLSAIQRLEQSPLAEDQILAVGLRLAGSRALRADLVRRLSAYFAAPASSLEIEAHRRTIWTMNRIDQPPIARAEQATTTLVQSISREPGYAARSLPHWAALYADLWCDPRIGADARARRIMLAMVSLLHERSLAADCR